MDQPPQSRSAPSRTPNPPPAGHSPAPARALRRATLVTLGLACVALTVGVLHLVHPRHSILAVLLGSGYLLFAGASVVLAVVVDQVVDKGSRWGHRVSRLGYGYLVVVALAAVLMVVGNLLYSIAPTPALGPNLGTLGLVYAAYFGQVGLGVAYLRRVLQGPAPANPALATDEATLAKGSRYHVQGKTRGILRLLLRLGVLGMFCVGSYAALVVVGWKSGPAGTYATEMFVPEFAPLLAVVLGVATALGLKTLQARRRRVVFACVLIVGTGLAGICALPWVTTPVAVRAVERDMTRAFGADWAAPLPPADAAGFLPTPHVTAGYFLGIRTTGYRLVADVPFFTGTATSHPKDRNLTLRFDAYLPARPPGEVGSGRNATVIRLHGGSWKYYDKGIPNGMHTSKHLAAQGYAVFDVQYGLNNSNPEGGFMTPASVVGNFSVDDMLRHVGYFTHYLAARADQFGANLSAVFVSGGSAGGQLACAAALAMASGNYTSLFNPALVVKGLVPFYPANGIPVHVGLVARPEFNWPGLLVTPASPPCLVFQGLQDGLVAWQTAARFQQAYVDNGSGNCVVMYLSFTRHANDLFVFEAPMQLAFLYYWERFMYLAARDLI